MTEYGRGYGSEPWHPDDPLYGDRGPYGGQAQQPQWTEQQSGGYPQEQHPQQYAEQYAPHPEQYRQQHPEQYGQHPEQYGQHGEQHPGPYPRHEEQYQQHQHPGQYPQHGEQQYAQQYPAGGGGWEGAPQQTGGPGYDPYDPYGQHPPADPYLQPGQDHPAPHHAGQGYPGQEYAAQDYAGQEYQGQGYAGAGQEYAGQDYAGHDSYGGQGGHGLQETQPIPAQQAVQTHPGPQHTEHGGPPQDAGDGHHPQDGPPAPEPEHPFFAGEPDSRRADGADDPDDADDRPGGAADDDAPVDGRRGRERRGRKNTKNKRRSGTACLVMALAFAGVAGTVGYFGYDFFVRHFGSSPDYDGEGSGEVQVEIPDGMLISQMGAVLARDGVIKSAGAFTEAAADNQKAQSLQPGTYTLRKHMSAAAAIELMLDPKSRNGLTIREGLRAAAVYQLIDKKLKLTPGTTKEIARSQAKNLGLPSWADDNPKIKDPLEGFLYPSTYSVGANAKPADVLKQMVARANQEYQKYDLAENARKFNLSSPLQLVTVASLTQAEGMTHDDFRKMAAVVYNRLAPTNTDTNQKLEFDSTFNYLKNQSKINISTDEIRHYDDPYNTYFYRGLPPGPIGNPGADALKAAINPDNSQKWLYFISVDGKKTDFTTNLTDHMKLVREFNRRQQEQKQNGN
ncbi:aminodeoxychorismate lyase [Streptomyces sp. NRRL F-4489]|uniref:endolytic transglycosylase MltG n=1 Tax=Streptomyces sp. NRRL F-4489 TaxID=1609095 RepID=UPI00074974A8|nr:endolytic transglycosylase MltG [Streptomyces sp. NRRL F-4489]KUL35168.1 aminodeoxychorismate lyase [Streptomyces sp. NRRL F-4489]